MVASAKTSGTSPRTIFHAKPSAIAVLPTPASPTNTGLFLRRRDSTCTVRSTSASRPISGSSRPSCAMRLRFCAYLSNAVSAFPSVDLPSPALLCAAAGESPASDFAVLRIPCETYWVRSRRSMPCLRMKYTACESFSPNIAINTSTPVTSLPS